MRLLATISILIVTCMSAQAQLFPNLGGQRAGIASTSFLKSDLNPRSVGMGGASIALGQDPVGILSNVSSIALNENPVISATSYTYGLGIQQSYLAFSSPFKGAGVGLSVNVLTSDAMEVRTEFQPDGTGELFYYTSASTGLSYAKKLSDNFNFGIRIKHLYEQIAQYNNHSAAADLGFLYHTDVKDLKFAVVVQNFGGKSKLVGDFIESPFNRDSLTSPDIYNLPTEFKLGLSVVPYKRNGHAILTAIQLNHPNDNSENLRLGVEYQFQDLLFARVGYKINLKGQQWPSFGIGFRTVVLNNPIYVNYAANVNSYTGWQHAFGLSLSVGRKKGNE